MNVFNVPSGLNHTEFIHLGGPDGVRLRDYGDVVQVHLEALLDQDAEEIKAAAQAALGWPGRVGWYS